ncbi:hypothetical protein FQR65_LT00047 [Abscondita terminalis]|nr:hypothetical protein FQR65_LT00047 [Abscondita terminalis]
MNQLGHDSDFGLIQCPFNVEFENTSMRCDWTGVRGNLTDHLHNHYKTSFQVGLQTFAPNFNITYVKIFFTVIYNVTFLVITQFIKSTDKFYCTVICCENAIDHRSFRYQLEFGRINDLFLILRKPCTEPFSDVQEIVNKRKSMIAADVTGLHLLINERNGLIFCKIIINKSPGFQLNQRSLQKRPLSKKHRSDQKSTNTDKVLDEIECRICNELVRPPIFMCSTGHSLCLACTVNVESCPHCCTPINDTRNFVLEKLTSNICTELSKLNLNEQSNTSYSKFLNETKCPICYEYMTPPIFVCPTGHSICSSCKDKGLHCPCCQLKIQNSRNFALEELSKNFNYPTKFKKIGGQFSINPEQTRLHNRHYSYALNPCPWKELNLCNSKKCFKDLIRHIRDKHSMMENNCYYFIEMNSSYDSYASTTFENTIFMICFYPSKGLKINFVTLTHRGINDVQPKHNDCMTPPIYMCSIGHSICGSCKVKTPLCPSCRMEIKDTRNFALEKLTTMFNYPCKYQIFGCKFMLNHEEFKSHHNDCLFAFDRCPLRALDLCNDVVPEMNLRLHLLDKHSFHILKKNSKNFIKMGFKGVSYSVTIIENAIFITFCETSEQFKINFITVLHTGMNNSESKYKYKLEFADQTGNGLKLIVSQLCQIVPLKRSSIFEECLSIPQEMLKPFIVKNPDPTVYFKFNIRKM